VENEVKQLVKIICQRAQILKS